MRINPKLRDQNHILTLSLFVWFWIFHFFLDLSTLLHIAKLFWPILGCIFFFWFSCLWCGMYYNWQECLNGEFVRVGPNPKFSPVAGYHWYILFNFIHVQEICVIAMEIIIIVCPILRGLGWFAYVHISCSTWLGSMFLISIIALCRFDGDGYVASCFLIQILICFM